MNRDRPKIIMKLSNPVDRCRWRATTHAVIQYLPQEWLDVAPPVYLFDSMLQAGAEFGMSWQLKRFIQQGSWAYSCLGVNKATEGIGYTEKKVVITAEWQRMAVDKVVPELALLHEFAHFVVHDIHGQPYVESQAPHIEFECDKLAIGQYFRMLLLHPWLASLSTHPVHRKFEDWARSVAIDVARTAPPGMPEEWLRNASTCMAEEAIKQLKWKLIYDSRGAHE